MSLRTLLIGLVFVFIFWHLILTRTRHSQIKLQERTPNLHFSFSDNAETSLWDLHGKVVLLHFWASWCAPCLKELPLLRELEETLAGEAFVVLAISLDGVQLEGAEKLPQNLIFQFSKPEIRPFGVNVVPMSFLIDAHGLLQKTYSGPRDWGDPSIVREIRSFLPPPR